MTSTVKENLDEWTKKVTAEERSLRRRFNEIRRLNKPELLEELGRFQVSKLGTMGVLQSRLLRAEVRNTQLRTDVPWDDHADGALLAGVMPRSPARQGAELESEKRPPTLMDELPVTSGNLGSAQFATTVVSRTAAQASTATTPSGDRPRSSVPEPYVDIPRRVLRSGYAPAAISHGEQRMNSAVTNSGVPMTPAMGQYSTLGEPTVRRRMFQDEVVRHVSVQASSSQELQAIPEVPSQTEETTGQGYETPLVHMSSGQRFSQTGGEPDRRYRQSDPGEYTEIEDQRRKRNVSRFRRRKYSQRGESSVYDSESEEDRGANRLRRRVPYRRPRREDLSTDTDSSDEEEWERNKTYRYNASRHSETEEERSSRHYGQRTVGPYSPVRSRGGSRRMESLNCLKFLQGWKLSFSGEGNPEDFLIRMSECREAAEMSDEELLKALPGILSGSASRWFRAVKVELTSWRRFVRKFRQRFVRRFDDDDIMDELKSRTQDKTERISDYLTSIKLILGYLRRPLSEAREVKIVFRNLAPEYRHYMQFKRLYDLSDIEHYGQKYERVREMDERYVPPPSETRSRIPAASFKGKSKAKVAAVTSGNPPPSPESAESGKQGGRKRNRKNGGGQGGIGQVKDQVAGFQERPKVDGKVQINPTISQQVPTSDLGPQQPFQGWGQGRGSGPRGNGYGGRPGYRFQPGAADPPVPRLTEPPDRQEYAHDTSQRAPRPFAGVCFVCQTPGHRSSECPRRTCRYCRAVGHYANECPQLVTRSVSCRTCGSRGVTTEECRNCERRVAENNRAGAGPGSATPARPDEPLKR